jgi:hypothetical protein
LVALASRETRRTPMNRHRWPGSQPSESGRIRIDALNVTAASSRLYANGPEIDTSFTLEATGGRSSSGEPESHHAEPHATKLTAKS